MYPSVCMHVCMYVCNDVCVCVLIICVSMMCVLCCHGRYRKAAEVGHKSAQLYLGVCYEQGIHTYIHTYIYTQACLLLGHSLSLYIYIYVTKCYEC